MASFVVFDVYDSEGRVSPWRMRITDQTVDTTVTDFVDAVAVAAFGATKPIIGGLKDVRLEIGALHSPIAPAGDTDIRNNWQARWSDSAAALFRNGIPGRNIDSALVSAGSLILASLDTTIWTNLFDALTTGAVVLENDKTGAVADSWGPVIAQVRARKRPRVGGRR